MRIFSSILFLLFLSANSFTAKVIRIIDGDSMVVLTRQNKEVYVRFEGIDCPEKKQDFGEKAKQVTSGFCLGKTVRIQKTGRDRYGRMLANVYVGNLCVNKELVRLGMAWHFKKYNHDPELAELELKARKLKVGIWSRKGAVPPWESRKIKKSRNL